MKSYIGAYVLVRLIFVGVFILGFVLFDLAFCGGIEEVMMRNDYNKAVDYTLSGDYEAAQKNLDYVYNSDKYEQLQHIDVEYKDIESVQHLCNALCYEAKGDYTYASYLAEMSEFEHLSKPKLKKAEKIQERIAEEAEQNRKEYVPNVSYPKGTVQTAESPAKNDSTNEKPDLSDSVTESTQSAAKGTDDKSTETSEERPKGTAAEVEEYNPYKYIKITPADEAAKNREEKKDSYDSDYDDAYGDFDEFYSIYGDDFDSYDEAEDYWQDLYDNREEW